MRWLDRPVPDLEELRALATRTVADARRAGEVIRRIRSLASPGERELLPLVLNDVVEEVLVFLAPELRRQGVEAKLDLFAQLPLRADRVQIQQVFANLAVNAIQAMSGRDERRLTIRTSLPSLTWSPRRCPTPAPAYPIVYARTCFKASSPPKKVACESASPSADQSSTCMADS
jgi:two-component system sensor kinase FixL